MGRRLIRSGMVLLDSSIHFGRTSTSDITGNYELTCLSNAGGGGERVLWAAIRATQKRWPNAKCVVYTGDHDVDKAAILARVKVCYYSLLWRVSTNGLTNQNRFNIHLYPPTVTFLYLTTRSWVLASSWPHFTLLGQSFGSIILTWDAFSLLTPDIFVDTMGYAFALGFSKILFRDVPTGAYVHYPTISTDMLSSLDPNSETGTQGINAGKGTGTSGMAKKVYWELFAMMYSVVGASIDIVMTNSTWTLEHIVSLWGGWRKELNKPNPIAVYPPVAVEELEKEVEISEASEKKRENILLYIAQFRPEKNHTLILTAFAEFKATKTVATRGAKLVLIGSVRDDGDSKRVYELRLLANELQIKDDVEFHLDASWPEILDWLRRASVGVNGMWNEHFGIGVVEYQAAGLISVVHNSGGPKRDIVIPIDGEPTGKCPVPIQLTPLLMRQASTQPQRRNSQKGLSRRWHYQISLQCGVERGSQPRDSQRRNLQRNGYHRWRNWLFCVNHDLHEYPFRINENYLPPMILLIV
jgi:alpha-1,2-mannosyltransferase